jgi:hypothetical protein
MRRGHGAARAWAVSTALLAAAAVAPAAGASTGGPLTLTCSAYSLPVAITDPGPADQAMWGQLCYRGSRAPATVQFLVHGVTYNHLYWDFPYGDGYYSYVDAATAAGYATFDVDRVGDGNSSHPPSADIDLNAGAVALHDAVTALRGGAVGGHAFQHVIMVGHSLGSMEAWIEDARYHDVDAVIITGALHAATPNLPSLVGDFYPASDDPKFAGSGLDSGYLTTRPGTREALFYEPDHQPGGPRPGRSRQGHRHCGRARGLDHAGRRTARRVALVAGQRARPGRGGRGGQPVLRRGDRLQLLERRLGAQLRVAVLLARRPPQGGRDPRDRP